MNGELVKRQDRWDLYAEDGSKIGSSAPNPMNKLSIKNCEAIANGYDLDELALDYYKLVFGNTKSYKDGFQKALEILGDKKFSEEDILDAWEDGATNNHPLTKSKKENLLKSLQQNEWDVVIVTEKFFEVKGNDGTIIYAEAMEEFGERNDYKLDSDGCLILKRK